jgi:hypothetical protein
MEKGNQLDAEFRTEDKGIVTRKVVRMFLIGMLCGVMIMATVTLVFAIPANNFHWQTEIWRRGGAAWTFDIKSGHMGWKWLVEPIPDAPPPKKPVTAPVYRVNVRAEQL